MLSDLQCWHLCQCCLRDHFHFIPSPEAPLDPWLRQCDECVAAGKLPQINERESDVPEKCATEGREEPPTSIESQEPAEVLPEAVPNHEALRAEALDDEGVSCAVACESRDDFELLRVLYEREITAETI
jgi:hypothetical protein